MRRLKEIIILVFPTGILSSALVAELSEDGKIMWGQFYTKPSFYYIITYILLFFVGRYFNEKVAEVKKNIELIKQVREEIEQYREELNNFRLDFDKLMEIVAYSNNGNNLDSIKRRALAKFYDGVRTPEELLTLREIEIRLLEVNNDKDQPDIFF